MTRSTTTAPAPRRTSPRSGGTASSPISLQVTDGFGNTDTDTSTVTVTNVAPTVAVDTISAIAEGATVTGIITDPGGWIR